MANHIGKPRLPLLPNPDHLRKQAKARLVEMKRAQPGTRLADAQHLLAQEYGFVHWAALQGEVSRRTSTPVARQILRRRSLLALLREQDPRFEAPPLLAGVQGLRPRDRLRHSACEEAPNYTPVAFLRAGMLVQISVLIATLVAIGIVCFLLHEAGVPIHP